MGFNLIATTGTQEYLASQGVEAKHVNKVMEGRPHIVDAMKNGEVDLVFNTTEGAQSLADSFTIRRTALMMKIPYYTTIAGAKACVDGIAAVTTGTMEVLPLQKYAKDISS